MADMSWKEEKKEQMNAGFWRRFFANVIDGHVIGLPLIVIETILTVCLFGSKLEYLTKKMESDKVTTDIIAQYANLQLEIFLVNVVMGILLIGVYYIVMEGSRQATLGKMVCNIKIVDEQNNPITYKQAIARYFARYVSAIFLIGYIIPLFRKDRRTLHDIITKTYIVNEDE